ncbi:MAG: hypothetical protein PHT33_11730 [bacterium]|nr:hypothetical protein [bacterium]
MGGAYGLYDDPGLPQLERSLREAFDRIEILEAAARLTILTELMGSARELSPTELAAIDALAGR